MNLFDILSSGKRNLSEENVSSLLAWLLDPSQSHGCGPLFLRYTLEKIDNKLLSHFLPGLSYSIAYRVPLELNVNVLVEEPVIYLESKRRDIDIVIFLENKSDTYIIAIENKIRETAYDIEQLFEEYEGLSKKYPDAKISFVYLTPSKSPKYQEAFAKLPQDMPKKHMTWTSGQAGDSGFSDILRRALREDDDARITPLSQELRFVIKSFIVFAENGFQPPSADVEISDKAGKSKYFKGFVGLSGLSKLLPDADRVYIGFVGGIAELENTPLEDLEKRSFKWDDSLAGNKQKSNWILLTEFQKVLEKKGWDSGL